MIMPAILARGNREMQKFGTAQPPKRVEDGRFLTGAGRYADDLRLPACFMELSRSPHAAARIISVHRNAARNNPGVAAVFSAADLDADGIGRYRRARGFARQP